MAKRHRSRSIVCKLIVVAAALCLTTARQLQQGLDVPLTAHPHHARRTDSHGEIRFYSEVQIASPSGKIAKMLHQCILC